MRFSKNEIFDLISKFGRAYFNPTMSFKNKQEFLKIIRKESFPTHTIKGLGDKLDTLFEMYNSCKSKPNGRKWEYFEAIDKAVKLAIADAGPQSSVGTEYSIETENEEDSEDDCVCEVVHNTPNDHKRSIDVNFDNNYGKRVKVDAATNTEPQIITKNNDADSNVQNEKLNECIENMTREITSTIKNATLETARAIKKKDNRLTEIYIMIKTLLDEQRETNETLKEVSTLMKSILAGQKVHYDMDAKQTELQKNHEFLLHQILNLNTE